MDTTGNSKGWDGNIDGLPDDTLVSVRLGDIRKSRSKSDSLFEYMRFIGNTGRHVMVRYDPEREYNGMYFTVHISDPSLPMTHNDRSWRADTINPAEALHIYIREVMKK